MEKIERLELISKDIAELIKENYNIEPVISEFESVTSEEENEEEIGFWNMHYGHFLDACIFIEDEDIFISLSFFYAVLPNYSATLVLDLSDLSDNTMVEIHDNFTYDEEYNMIFGEEAEKLIAEEHDKRILNLAEGGAAELFYLHTAPGYVC